MFTVYLVNFQRVIAQLETLADAIAECRRAGFEARVDQDGVIVGTWSPIAGWRRW